VTPLNPDMTLQIRPAARRSLSVQPVSCASLLRVSWPSGPVEGDVFMRVSASPRSSLADVAVRPGVQQAGRVQASPSATADCGKAYKVARWQPARIQQARVRRW